jgi:ferrochelatase
MTNHAVLLANLGSPDNPDVPSVRRYLDQFLMDPYVIQLPWLLRRLIVSLFVLPTRPKRSAEAYRSIWTDRGSPLIALSRDLLDAVTAKTRVPVALGMRYGNPSIESALLELATDPKVGEIFYIPLYPHYADSTVTTSVKEAERVIARHNLAIRLRVIAPFYNHPDYVDALVASAAETLSHVKDYDHVLFSYHGLPELHITKADPTGSHCMKVPDCCSLPSPAHATCYRHQVMETTRLFVQLTGLPEDRYSVTFQSRLGRAKWLEPATEDTLKALAGKGVKRVLVLCPAFITDCLETLEEIEIQGDEVFKAAGGDSLTLLPCLNNHPAWVNTLTGWIEAQ